MTSRALAIWQSDRASQLDEVEAAHAAIGGTGRGRRYATQQVNHAYAMLLSAQFQGFCRDLHSECVDHLTLAVSPPAVQDVLQAEFMRGRKLDSGNPNPGNIGSDFNRLGLRFWDAVVTEHARNSGRRDRLDILNRWRNAIAHQDFDPTLLGGTTLRLHEVKAWRNACNGLAASFDSVMATYIHALIGTSPW